MRLAHDDEGIIKVRQKTRNHKNLIFCQKKKEQTNN